MGLKKLAAKMADYNERLKSGKVSEIKPGHVEKVLKKLEEEIASARSPEKRALLERKLDVARTQEERAEWLLKEIG